MNFNDIINKINSLNEALWVQVGEKGPNRIVSSMTKKDLPLNSGSITKDAKIGPSDAIIYNYIFKNNISAYSNGAAPGSWLELIYAGDKVTAKQMAQAPV